MSEDMENKRGPAVKKIKDVISARWRWSRDALAYDETVSN
jgi:hypothetical protein